MLLKEQGYDEFLAEKIRRGQENVKVGRTITLNELDRSIEQLLERKAVELDEAEQGLIYG